MSSILKTGDLIRSIKRRAFIPSSQETFTDEDLLEMATEEVNLGLVPLIERMHEEHLVYYIEVELELNKKRYPIPARAHGNKLRDVALVDENDNVFEMHRYSINELSDFSNTTAYINARGFYLENNDVILTNFQTNIGQKLRLYFYMRPNVLVLESMGASILSISDEVEDDQISPVSGSMTSLVPSGSKTIITSSNHGLPSNSKVRISSTGFTIDGNVYAVSIIDANTFSIGATIPSTGTSGTFTLSIDVKKLSLDSFPKKFNLATSTHFDFVQHISPNKIMYYDIPVNKKDDSVFTISFPADAFSELPVGSHVTVAEDSIVPNIPTELHPILAQRVAVSCLEAMGDEANKQSAERKLAAMEKDAGTFLDNRVEGAQQKIKSRHSPLVNTLNTLGRRNRRW
jgi:hypothetical protein